MKNPKKKKFEKKLKRGLGGFKSRPKKKFGEFLGGF